MSEYRDLGDSGEHCVGCGFDWASCVCSARRRRERADDCAYCARHKPGEMCPPHDASRNCESGQRHHCTCDVCF